LYKGFKMILENKLGIKREIELVKELEENK
jgi:hypothetical protein